MKKTLQELLKECLRDSRSQSRGGLDPNKYPSQILCLAEMVQFTERCEEAIKSNSLHEFLRDLQQQLEGYTGVDLTGQDQASQDEGMAVLELKLKALILDTVHNIEVVEKLIDGNIRSVTEWLWQKQLR